MLEELGEPYELSLLSLAKEEQRKPEYLAINPMGKVPALKHGDAVVTEVAAICTYLADEFPHARLNIPVGDPRRGPYLKWLFFSPSCIEPAVIGQAPLRARSRPAAACSAMAISIRSWTWLVRAWQRGPYLMGDQFTAADVVVGSMLRWGMMFNLLPERPEFRAYVDRLEQRPALQRATALDRELAAA